MKSSGELLPRVLAKKASRIDLVFDTYLTQSIKNSERGKRAASETEVFQRLRADQKVPKQYGKFLKNGKNKTRLIQFIFSFLSSAIILNLHGMQLFLTHDILCHSITAGDQVVVQDIPELTCDHEETDTRLLLHSQHASQDHDSVVICSRDSDVAIMAYCLDLSLDCELFIRPHGGRRYCVPRSLEKLDVAFRLAMPGLHCFTGCDTFSAFEGKGKKKAFKAVKENRKFTETFQNLGKDWVVS